MELLNRTEVADFFGVTTKTIMNWEKKKILKSIKIGAVIRFRKQDLKELLENSYS